MKPKILAKHATGSRGFRRRLRKSSGVTNWRVEAVRGSRYKGKLDMAHKMDLMTLRRLFSYMKTPREIRRIEKMLAAGGLGRMIPAVPV